MLALIFRKVASYTTGFAFERALDYLGVDYCHVDNNDVHLGKVSLREFDSALWVDDGFTMKHLTLHDLPVNSACYLIDTHIDPDGYLPYVSEYKHIYCAQYTYGFRMFQEAGINAKYLPLAWDSIGIPYAPRVVEQPFYDVSFIASASTEQRWMLRDIVRYKYDGATVECMGEVMAERLCETKIGLNVLGGVGYLTRYDHINLRTFETLGCGALLCQQDLLNPYTKSRIDDMEILGLKGVQGWFRNVKPSGEHFWDRKQPSGDEHYVWWRDMSQLTATLDYYIDAAHEDERQEIAARGKAWVDSGHTFIHRAERILDDMGVRR